MEKVIYAIVFFLAFGVMPYAVHTATHEPHTPMTLHPLRVYNSSFPDKTTLTRAPFYCHTDSDCEEAEEDQWDMHTHVILRVPEYWMDVEVER